MAKGNVFTGARAQFSVNGKKVGFARNVSGSETIEMESVDLLDNIETDEHVPVRYNVSFNCERVRVVGNTLRSHGIWPITGNNSQQHIRNILLTGELTITITDNQTNLPIMVVEGARATSRDFSVDARGIASENVSFVARRMRDETET